MRLTDSHCHLQDARLAGDLEGVLARAREAGVRRFVACGTAEADWDAVLALAARHADVVPLLGLHPWYVGQATPGWVDRLEAQLQAHPEAGIGEAGLDFALEELREEDRQRQEDALRAQLRLAKALDRPLSLHCRRAWEPLATLAREEGLPARGAVVHAFSGSAETARELQALGFHLSFGCGLARPGAAKAARALRAVSLDRLLLETDAPDLPPRHLPGWEARPNEPAALRVALAAAAQLLGLGEEDLAARIEANAARIFG